MVCTFVKKRSKPDVSETVEEAVRAVQERRLSTTVAASRYGLTHTALHYRIKKIGSGDMQAPQCVYFALNKSANFLIENRELILVDYKIDCSSLNYGMTYRQIRRLAYDYGRLQCKFSSSWIDNKTAGIDQLQGFMRSHNNLTLASPKIQVSSGPRRSIKQM